MRRPVWRKELRRQPRSHPPVARLPRQPLPARGTNPKTRLPRLPEARPLPEKFLLLPPLLPLLSRLLRARVPAKAPLLRNRLRKIRKLSSSSEEKPSVFFRFVGDGQENRLHPLISRIRSKLPGAAELPAG